MLLQCLSCSFGQNYKINTADITMTRKKKYKVDPLVYLSNRYCIQMRVLLMSHALSCEWNNIFKRLFCLPSHVPFILSRLAYAQWGLWNCTVVVIFPKKFQKIFKIADSKKLHVSPFIALIKTVISWACPPNKVKTFCDTKQADLDLLQSPWSVCARNP